MSRTSAEKEKIINKVESENVKSNLECNQDFPTYVKQCIKVQNHHDNNLGGGKFFTIAHLYLTTASLARDNSKVTLTETNEDMKLENLPHIARKEKNNTL